jgi:hypothetical protein
MCHWNRGRSIVLSFPPCTLVGTNAINGDNAAVLSFQFDDVHCCSVTINLLALCIAVMLLLHPHASTDQSSVGSLNPVQSKAVRWQQCIDGKKCVPTNQMVSKFVVHWRLLLLFVDHCIHRHSFITAFQHVCSMPWVRPVGYMPSSGSLSEIR